MMRGIAATEDRIASVHVVALQALHHFHMPAWLQSRSMGDPKRTYVRKEKFLCMGEPNTGQEPHPWHSNIY